MAVFSLHPFCPSLPFTFIPNSNCTWFYHNFQPFTLPISISKWQANISLYYFQVHYLSSSTSSPFSSIIFPGFAAILSSKFQFNPAFDHHCPLFLVSLFLQIPITSVFLARHFLPFCLRNCTSRSHSSIILQYFQHYYLLNSTLNPLSISTAAYLKNSNCTCHVSYFNLPYCTPNSLSSISSIIFSIFVLQIQLLTHFRLLLSVLSIIAYLANSTYNPVWSVTTALFIFQIALSPLLLVIFLYFQPLSTVNI